MTRMRALPFVLAAAVLAACADASPTVVATDALETHRTVANACPGLEDGCTPVSDVVDIAAIDIGDAYIESTAGRRYYVSWSTQFLPVTLPPSPISPNDPIVPAWNTLVESRASYKAFLALLRTLPPNPVLPPNPIRFQVEALFDGTDYYLASLQPVLVASEGF
jgi:hypothetical protein